MMARILIVDDEKWVRDVLVAELEKAKFEVAVEDRGDAALTEAGNNKYDVALVDCQMQGGGTELYFDLKEQYSDMLVIAMTDLGSEAEIEKGLVPPADAAWAKDFSNPEKKPPDAGIKGLVKLIHTLLEWAKDFPNPEKKPPDAGIKCLVKLIHTLLEKKGGVVPE